MEHLVWDINPEIFQLWVLAPRWYGLCFATAMLVGYWVVRRSWFDQGYSEETYNEGFILVVFGTIIGARLGHCLFYQPEYYLSKPWKILFIWEGGLASHGGTIGVIAVILYFTWKHRISFIWLADRMAPGIALCVPFIRIGNFFNSEIVGKPSDVPWAVVFKRVDDLPRHPAQLYEAASYFLVGFILLFLDRRYGKTLKRGKLIGLMFIGIFTARFIIEFFKKEQEAFERGMTLNMGQILSIPMVLLGLFFFFGGHNLIKIDWGKKQSNEPDSDRSQENPSSSKNQKQARRNKRKAQREAKKRNR